MYKHKLIKELPNHKIGEVVQFFGFCEKEPYKSILKESQIIPEIGWYWKDDIERKGCITNYSEYCKCKYNVDTLPDWFAPYLFTTEDGIEYYDCYNDFDKKYFYIHRLDNKLNWSRSFDTIKLKHQSYNEWREQYKIFSTKKSAEQYLQSLKFKFKVGNIVVVDCFTYEIFGKVNKIKENQLLVDKIWVNDEHIKLANSKQIIKYYTQQGWQEGALLNTPEGNRKLYYLFIENNQTICCFIKGLGIQSYELSLCTLIKYKIGDFIIVNNIFKDICKITSVSDSYYYSVEMYDKEKASVNIKKVLRKATEKEIVQYYENQGWIKGAEFICKNTYLEKTYYNHTVDHLEFINNVLHIVFDKNFKYKLVEECELSKPIIKNVKYGSKVCYTSNFDLILSYPINIEKVQLNTLSNCYSENNREMVTGTQSQYKNIKAFMKLSILNKEIISIYNKLNNYDWKPNWNNHFGKNYVIKRFHNKLIIIKDNEMYFSLSFPSKELAEFSLLHHKELWEQYYELK
jgi:hypothetical protein